MLPSEPGSCCACTAYAGRMAKWVTTMSWGMPINVTPLDDLILHTESESCFCGPRVSFLDVQPHGRYQYVKKMIVHEAMDGRE